jgi:hypothetical protein
LFKKRIRFIEVLKEKVNAMNFGLFGWSMDDYKLVLQISGIVLIIFMLVYIGISSRDQDVED